MIVFAIGANSVTQRRRTAQQIRSLIGCNFLVGDSRNNGHWSERNMQAARHKRDDFAPLQESSFENSKKYTSPAGGK
jgi:hypothetical protein